METEGGIMGTSDGTLNADTSVSANAVNEGRRRGDAWTEYDGIE
jgi:hypothetical protein